MENTVPCPTLTVHALKRGIALPLPEGFRTADAEGHPEIDKDFYEKQRRLNNIPLAYLVHEREEAPDSEKLFEVTYMPVRVHEIFTRKMIESHFHADALHFGRSMREGAVKVGNGSRQRRNQPLEEIALLYESDRCVSFLLTDETGDETSSFVLINDVMIQTLYRPVGGFLSTEGIKNHTLAYLRAIS